MARRLLRVLAGVALVALAACAPPGPPDNDRVSDAARETFAVAEAGDPVAQTVLGTMFEAGVFGRPDYRAAAQWYARAVEQADPLAAFYLANLSERGLGVPQDYARAAALYAMAAESGNASAAFKLGFLYEKGLGVPQDFVRARALYDEAQRGWLVQGLSPLAPAYLTAGATPEEVEAQIAAAQQVQGAPALAPEIVPPAPEPPVEVAPAPAAPALDVLGDGFHVHLASEKSVEAAMADWQELRVRFPDLLGPLTPALATLDLGAGGTYYQLLAGPIDSESGADILCARLQPQGQYCNPLPPQG